MEQLDLQYAVPLVRRSGVDAPVWDVTVFTKNRDRLLEGDIAARFPAPPSWSRPELEAAALDRALLGRWHADRGLGVDEELPPKDGSGEPPAPGRNGERDFHGEKRSNETHASTTDPDARLYRKARRQASQALPSWATC